MVDTITHSTKIGDARELLGFHGADTPHGWEMVIGMLLDNCDYITLDGFGSNAVFRLNGKAALLERGVDNALPVRQARRKQATTYAGAC